MELTSLGFLAFLIIMFCTDDIIAMWNRYLSHRERMAELKVGTLLTENKKLQAQLNAREHTVDERLETLETIVTDEDAELNRRLLKAKGSS